MPVNKPFVFDVDLNQPYGTQPMKLIQGDTNSDTFIITVKENGIVQDLTDTTATVTILKPDNTRTVGSCTMIDAIAGTIKYIVGTNEKAVVGVIRCSVQIYSSGNTTRTSSHNFKATVMEDLDNGSAVASTTEYSLLTTALAQFNTATFSEADQKTYEQLRKDAELIRISNENTRLSNESSRVTVEGNRVTAENTRINNETTRQTLYNAVNSAMANGDFDATVTVGTITTGEAGTSVIVTNTGTPNDAILNFTIPKGIQGPAGPGTGDMTASSYDSNGDFKVNSADIADKLATARTINGVSFDGTANITVADSTKEPTITKNTAFNKNYGTNATDVKMNGTQAVGSTDAIARIDHVHPVDTSRASASDVSSHLAEFANHVSDDVKHIDYATASGTNTYTVTIANITALVEGMSIKVKFTNVNTGASTLNINSLGAVAIKKGNGNALSSGNIKAGQICHLVYTGSVFQLLGEGGEYGTAGAEQTITGYTVGTENGIVNGTAIADPISSFTAGDKMTLLNDATGYTSTVTNAYTKKLEYQVKKSGVVRVTFTLGGNNGTCYAQIYKNGVAVGTVRQNTYQPLVEYTEDISCNVNDLIQIYLKNSSSGNLTICGNVTMSVGNTSTYIIKNVV